MNDEIKRRGPWDAPLPSYNKHKPIVVLVHDLVKEASAEDVVIEQHFELDYGDYEDRKFLGRLSFWAINNQRSIETMAIEEWEKIKDQ